MGNSFSNRRQNRSGQLSRFSRAEHVIQRQNRCGQLSRFNRAEHVIQRNNQSGQVRISRTAEQATQAKNQNGQVSSCSTTEQTTQGNDQVKQVRSSSTTEQTTQGNNQNVQVSSCITAEQTTQDSVLPLCVAAIDFGATFTGYAFMCRGNDFKLDMNNIEGKEWHADRWIRHKTPTSVLFKNTTFYNFGYEAESFYSDQVGMEDHGTDKWLFFQNMKIDITEEQEHLDDQYMLYDIRKKNRMKAIDVIMEIIKYLRGDLVNTLAKRLKNFDESCVQWILTVPVIWNLTTRGFLQKAAIMAGIPKHRQTLLLEPEAAALYCEQKELEILRGKDGQRILSRLPLNEKYLVVDLGGGTIDITVHRRGQGDLTYKDKALGLKWGGKKVNECFEKYFEEYCSLNIGISLTELKEKHPDDYLYLMENFEQEKIKFTVDQINKSEIITVRLPGLLSKNKPYKLSIPSSTFRSFFDTSINGLVKKLNQLLQSDVNEIKDVNTMLVVGGFGESSIVISELKSKFSNFDIIVPENPGLAVMYGAVLFGFLKDLEDNNVNLTKGIQRCGTEKQAYPFRHRSLSGANKVEHFLSQLVGRDVINGMLKEQLNQLVGQFQDNISKFKKGHVERDKVIFTLPIELRELYTDEYNKTLEDGLQKFNGDVSCKKDKLIITSPFFQKHFLQS